MISNIRDLGEEQRTRLEALNASRHTGSSTLAYHEIKDIDYKYAADIGLAYASPVRGVWNIVHIGTLVPGGHQVYVCPTSCLRGVVLTTAEMGRMDKLSTITVGEDNILDGDMEEMLQRGVERIIRELPQRPRMMMIFTSCIHHFMAVNYKRVYQILAKKYPDIDFVDCYMDPIMRRTSPVVPSLWRQMHRVLRPVEEAPISPANHIARSQAVSQVNLLGNCFPHTSDHCDLAALLESKGIQVLEANSCKDYDEFLSMNRSACNFFFHGTGRAAARDLEARLGQPYMHMRPGYSYEEFNQDLLQAGERIGLCEEELHQLESELLQQQAVTETALQDALDIIQDTPISIDYTAVDCPLEFALFLLRHGFNVESVMVDNFTEREEIFRQLQELKPELRIYESYGWNIRKMPRGHQGKILCIGQKSAYFMDSDYFVNEVENAGMYGYRGIRRMLDLMKEAHGEAKPMKDLVQIKGWECHCCRD